MSETKSREIPDFAKMKPEELPDTFVHELFKPIQFGKGDNTEIHTMLELREPDIDEIDKFVKNVRSKGEIEALKFFIAQVADKPFVLIGKMGARDMMVAQEYLTAFMRGSQKTGDTSPE
jgi:hypothetical protein